MHVAVAVWAGISPHEAARKALSWAVPPCMQGVPATPTNSGARQASIAARGAAIMGLSDNMIEDASLAVGANGMPALALV